MLYESNIYQMEVEGHSFWVAESKVLKGCVGQGQTSAEAILELESNEAEWISTAKEFGISIPPQKIKTEKTYSGKVSLRMSPYVHEMASNVSNELGISLNQFINDALVEYTNRVSLSLRKPLYTNMDGETTSKMIQFPSQNKFAYTNVQEELEEM